MTIEYLVLLCVIIAALILGATNFIKPGTKTAMSDLGNVLNKEMQKIIH